MPSHVIFLDESGDLGWSFDQPFRRGGSSRYLTIAYLIGPSGKFQPAKRLVRKAYDYFGFDPKIEVKGAELDAEQLDYIAYRIVDMMKSNPELKLGAITVKKENVKEHIRADSNLIYNYMIRLGVLPRIAPLSEVHLIRDNRSIKIKSGRSLQDYLQAELWFECSSKCILHDCPAESHTNLNIMFIDWVSHIIWSNYEDNESKHFKVIRRYLCDVAPLFF
jgi:Protein of unknown function (DUF3800)